MPTTLEKPSVAYLEKLFHQTAIDSEFRSELQSHPEAFGISADLELPQSVEKQDESFVELLNNALGEIDIAAECASTCSFGIVTIVCDGTTK
uniref:DivA n=1 Tax=Prochloron didemni TaxID=1216 RepID=A0A2H4GZ80_PRODI|nr:DivA [Prochloron didemni]